MVQHVSKAGIAQEVGGRLALIDSGSSATFKPSTYIKSIGRTTLDQPSASQLTCRIAN